MSRFRKCRTTLPMMIARPEISSLRGGCDSRFLHRLSFCLNPLALYRLPEREGFSRKNRPGGSDGVRMQTKAVTWDSRIHAEERGPYSLCLFERKIRCRGRSEQRFERKQDRRMRNQLRIAFDARTVEIGCGSTPQFSYRLPASVVSGAQLSYVGVIRALVWLAKAQEHMTEMRYVGRIGKSMAFPAHCVVADTH